MLQERVVLVEAALLPIGAGHVCSSRGCWPCGGWLASGMLVGSAGLGSRVGFIGYSVQCVAAVVELPALNTLTCWLTVILYFSLLYNFFLFQICQLILEYHSYIFSSLLFPLKIFIWILIHFKNLTCFVYEYQSWNVSSVWYFTPISSSCEAFLPLTGAFVSVLLYPRFMLFFSGIRGTKLPEAILPSVQTWAWWGNKHAVCLSYLLWLSSCFGSCSRLYCMHVSFLSLCLPYSSYPFFSPLLFSFSISVVLICKWGWLPNF